MNTRIQKMCAAALLCAVGILVPLISPVKVSIGPMSFTLASHVALFLAMFMSPAIAGVVCLGTTIGFFIAGFPLVVVARAASQVVFVMIGANILSKFADKFKKPAALFGLGLGLALIHAGLEMLVVFAFTFIGVPIAGGIVPVLFGLVGVGTVAHSMVDLGIALMIWAPCAKFIKVPISFKLPERQRI